MKWILVHSLSGWIYSPRKEERNYVPIEDNFQDIIKGITARRHKTLCLPHCHLVFKQGGVGEGKMYIKICPHIHKDTLETSLEKQPQWPTAEGREGQGWEASHHMYLYIFRFLNQIHVWPPPQKFQEIEIFKTSTDSNTYRTVPTNWVEINFVTAGRLLGFSKMSIYESFPVALAYFL